MHDHLPDVIARYQQAHDRHDTDTALAAFAPDAIVLDDGHTYAGLVEIRSWLADAASEYTFTRTLNGVDGLDDGQVVVHNHLSGDFPGGEVDLRYRFRLRGDHIERLEIAP